MNQRRLGLDLIIEWAVIALGIVIMCWATSIAPVRDLGFVEEGWFAISHLITNSFHTWMVLPPFAWVMQLTSTTQLVAANRFCWIFASLFYLGSISLLRLFRKEASRQVRWIDPAVLAMTFALWINVVGRDTVVLSALAFLPLTAVTLMKLLRYPSDATHPLITGTTCKAIFLVSFVCHLLTALQLSVVTVSVVATIAFVVVRTPGRMAKILVWLLIPAILISFFAPIASFPSYAAGTHLVPDDGVPGMIRPMIGPEYSIPIMNREAVKSSYWGVAAASLAIVLGSLIFVRDGRSRSVLGISAVLLFFATGDLLLPESLALILPGQTLPRVIPGLFFFSITPLVLHCGIVLMLLGLSAFPSRAGIGAALGASAVLFGIGWVSSSFQPSVDLMSRPSPSLTVVQSMAQSVGRNAIDLQRFKALSTQPADRLTSAEVDLSTNVEGRRDPLKRMLDNRAETRWSSGSGRQLGNEELTVRFVSPEKLDGLLLDPGVFKADFPRGLIVEQCDGTKPVLSTHRSWQGSVVFNDEGLPAFSGQHHVRIIFAETVTTQCLLVKQVGTTDHFDWSVAELSVIRAKDR